jgi:hypothetical protein
LIVETGGLKDGRHTTELWFDGSPRLRLTYLLKGDQARVLTFASLAADPEAALAVGPAAAPARQEQPGKLPVTDKEWDARDLEGKWALYQKIASADEKIIRAFSTHLAGRKDFAFLEMIALHRPLLFEGIDAAKALAKADAPQWLRVAAWLRLSGIDHAEVETELLFTEHHPARAIAWLDRYAAEATLSKGEQVNPRHPLQPDIFRSLLRKLKKKYQPDKLGDALPPLEPAEVFRHLDAPKDLAQFGDRNKAEPGKVYVHQVQRAIKGFLQSGKYREPWLGKMLKLTRHPQPQVRQAAYLAFTQLEHALDPKNNPIEEFRRVMDDPKETPAIREGALMAFSYLRHPQVFVRLHELALEPANPVWRAAVSRLDSVGNEFTLKHLGRVGKAKLSDKDAAVLEETRKQLQRWADDPNRGPRLNAWSAVALLEYAAWAEAAKSPLAKTLGVWTLGYVVLHAGPTVVERLEQVQKEYQPEFVVPDAPAFTQRVRRLAGDVLSKVR